MHRPSLEPVSKLSICAINYSNRDESRELRRRQKSLMGKYKLHSIFNDVFLLDAEDKDIYMSVMQYSKNGSLKR